jgi:hypothetical protein
VGVVIVEQHTVAGVGAVVDILRHPYDTADGDVFALWVFRGILVKDVVDVTCAEIEAFILSLDGGVSFGQYLVFGISVRWLLWSSRPIPAV